MPTRPGFDVVPLRKETKRRLAALKGDGSYDEAIVALLERAEAPPAQATPAARERHPEDEVALARLAARRWRHRVERGQIEEIGPRLLIYHTRKQPRKVLHVEWDGRRGFAP